MSYCRALKNIYLFCRQSLFYGLLFGFVLYNGTLYCLDNFNERNYQERKTESREEFASVNSGEIKSVCKERYFYNERSRYEGKYG